MNNEIKQKLITVLQKFNTREYGYLQPCDILKHNVLIINDIQNDILNDIFYINTDNILYFTNVTYENIISLLYNDIQAPSKIYYINNTNNYVIDNMCLINLTNNSIVGSFNRDITAINDIIKKYNIISLNYCAFECHSKLADVDFNTIKYINNSAFSFAYALTSINLCNVINIEKSAFEYCDNISIIKNSEKVQYIGDYAFIQCSKITSIQLGKSLYYLGKHAFEDCILLHNINLQDTSITELFESTFSYSIIEAIQFPTSLQKIYPLAFLNCKKLKILYFKDFNHIVDIYINDACNLPSDYKIVVPDNLFDKWVDNTEYPTKQHMIKESEFLYT